jgi:hypothetical protein
VSASSDLTKSGLHAVWPEVFVDKEQAYAFREAAIEALTTTFGSPAFEATTWAEILDATVYNDGTGLRMLGAGKPFGKGTIYMPSFVLGEDASVTEKVPMDQVFKKLPEWLQRCSICATGSKSPACLLMLPTSMQSSSLSARRNQKKTPHKRSSSSGAKGRRQQQEDEMPRLAPEQCSDLIEAVRAIISEPAAAAFKTAPVRFVQPYQHKELGPCAVLSLNTKRCINLANRSCHQNNHTYLVVQGARVAQKCLSERTTDTVYGACNKLDISISASPGLPRSPDKAPYLVTAEQWYKAKQQLLAALPAALKLAKQTKSMVLEPEAVISIPQQPQLLHPAWPAA